MSLRRMLSQRATIRNRTETGTLDGHGNPEVSVAEIEDVPCRLEVTGPREVLIGRESYLSTHRAAFLGGTEIGGSSEVEIEGTTFDVVGRPNRGHFPAAGEVVVEVDLLEIVPG